MLKKGRKAEPNQLKSSLPKKITLRQLYDIEFIQDDGKPATLYQIIWRPYKQRSDIALNAAKAGDFEQSSALVDEINKMISEFIQHATYLLEETAILKDPEGPEAKERASLFKLVRENAGF